MAQAIIRVLRAQNAKLEKRNAELEKRMAQLEAKLAKDLRNSSNPPSTQHPHAKPEPKLKLKSKRKRGEQPRHQKFERALISTDECDEVVTYRGCGKRLRDIDQIPLRQQVWDVVIRPVVVEYQQDRLTCRCGVSTCGEMPEIRRRSHQTDAFGHPDIADELVSYFASQSGRRRQ